MEAITLDDVDGAEDVVVHTHRVVPGAATSSYAMRVAKMAGLPADVCARADELLREEFGQCRV